MANNDWLGHAPAVAQVDTITVGGTPAATNTLRVTVPSGGAKFVEITLTGSPTTATAAAQLYEALVASTIPELTQDITFSYDASGAPNDVVATASTPGKPFSIAVSDTGAVTLTKASTVVSSGPNDAAIASNWSLNATPGATDTVRFRQGPDCLYNLGTWTIAAFEHHASYTNRIGLPYRNGGENGYVEYRTRFAVLDTTNVKTHIGEGSGSPRLQLGLIAASSAMVFGTGQREDEVQPALEFSTTGNPTRIEVAGSGDVGIVSTSPGGSPTVATLAISNEARVTVGPTATITATDHDGGTLDSYGALTTLNQTAGNTTTHDGSVGTINADSACNITLNHTGTVTAINAIGQGPGNAPVVDFSKNQRPLTLTNATFKGGAAMIDPNKRTTRTNPMTFDKASLQSSDIGETMTIA